MPKPVPYTAKDAIAFLQTLPPDTILISQRDPEGNGYSPTMGIAPAHYVPIEMESSYSGEVVDEDEREYLEKNGLDWTDTVPCAVVFPRH